MFVYISQPMSGKSEEEIIAVREKIFGDYQADHPEATLLGSYMNEVELNRMPVYKNQPVALLGEAMQVMADADVVLFAPGWEKHRGCRIEDRVATYYDIKKVYVR